jgi:hypothetical protein
MTHVMRTRKSRPLEQLKTDMGVTKSRAMLPADRLAGMDTLEICLGPAIRLPCDCYLCRDLLYSQW